jgi:hypothetical protein
MKRIVALVLSPLLLAQTSPPLVPEGVHELANGPANYCGITAASAADFERQVMASAKAVKTTETDQFVAYEGPKEMTMWVFSKPGATAYPLATCRYLTVENGATYMGREMRCDDTRERCDRAFLEFRELDEQAKRSIQSP